MPPARRPLGIAVAGFGWMGRVHTQAYLRLLHHYPSLTLAPQLIIVADEVPGRAEEACAQYGFATPARDWREILDDPRIDAVSVAAPNFLHAEIGSAVARAGKHLWIEKPVGLTTADATAVADAVAAAGVQSAVGFNYRNAPAVEAARDLIADGDIGTVTHGRFRFFSDYAGHPDGALTWRYEQARGGNGVLGDLASHAVDLAAFVLGDDIDALVADSATFIPQRPKPSGATVGHGLATGGELGPVENVDYVSALVRFTSGARIVTEASRVAVGEQNAYGFEIHGTRGMVAWDFRRLGELSLSTGDSYQDQPLQTVFVGPKAGEYAAFQPGSASAMSYDDLKVIEAYRFVKSIETGTSIGTSLADAVRSASVLDAMTESVATGAWVRPAVTR